MFLAHFDPKSGLFGPFSKDFFEIGGFAADFFETEAKLSLERLVPRLSRSGEHNAPLIRFAHEPPLAA